MRKVLTHPLTLPIAMTAVSAIAALVASQAKRKSTREFAQLVASAAEVMAAAGPAVRKVG